MDYGTYLKKLHGNQNVRSRHYTKQSTFKGSNREVRGAIICALQDQSLSRVALTKKLTAFDSNKIDTQLRSLVAEGLVQKSGQTFRLP